MTQPDSITLTLAEIIAPIQEPLLLVESRMLERVNGQHDALTGAIEHVLRSGGKRVRPILALLVAGLLGVDWQHVVTLGAAIEMLHTASLVHDDLIDGSLLRRGTSTLNHIWTPAATVLTGDYLFARAANLATQTENLRVMDMFSQTIQTMVNGELQQMFTSKTSLSRADYDSRIYAKTASVFELATSAVGMLGEKSPEICAQLAQFGRQIGLAFQIIDDILDYTGDSNAIGKPVGSDLYQGLFTLPMLYYAEQNPTDPTMLALQAGGYHQRDLVAKMVGLVQQSDAIPRAWQEAGALVQQAQHLLTTFPANAYTNPLLALTNYLMRRTV